MALLHKPNVSHLAPPQIVPRRLPQNKATVAALFWVFSSGALCFMVPHKGLNRSSIIRRVMTALHQQAGCARANAAALLYGPLALPRTQLLAATPPVLDGWLKNPFENNAAECRFICQAAEALAWALFFANANNLYYSLIYYNILIIT